MCFLCDILILLNNCSVAKNIISGRRMVYHVVLIFLHYQQKLGLPPKPKKMLFSFILFSYFSITKYILKFTGIKLEPFSVTFVIRIWSFNGICCILDSN